MPSFSGYERPVRGGDQGDIKRQDPIPYYNCTPIYTVGGLYVAKKIVSPSHLLKAGLSLNCLKSSVWSVSSSTITRFRALSCSMRAFYLSECFIAFW